MAYQRYLRLSLITVSLFIMAFATIPAAYAEPPPTSTDVGKAAILQKLKGVGEPQGEQATVTPQRDPVVIAGRIVRAALVLVGVIFFALMIYGGSLWLTAGGNEEQVKQARHIIVRASIGAIIVLFAGAITQFLVNQLGRPVAPPTSGPEYIDAPGFTEGCPPGYSYVLNAPDETGIEGDACRRN